MAVNSLTRDTLSNTVKYTSMLAGNAAYQLPGSYDLISSSILTSTQSSVTLDLSGLSATYKHLQIRMVTKANSLDYSDNYTARVNGDSGSNYSFHRIYGDGSGVGAGGGNSATSFIPGRFARSTGSSFFPSVLDIYDAFSTVKTKTFRAIYGSDSANFNFLANGGWYNTAAMTSITFLSAGDFAVGSRFSLYGIKG